jgi:hypothetical protein
MTALGRICMESRPPAGNRASGGEVTGLPLRSLLSKRPEFGQDCQEVTIAEVVIRFIPVLHSSEPRIIELKGAAKKATLLFFGPVHSSAASWA